MPVSRFALSALLMPLLGVPTPSQVFAPIAVGDASNTVTSMASWRRAVAVLPDGTLWALVRVADATNGGQLYLTASVDGGRTWAGRFDVPTQNDGAGAVCASRDCGRIHVAWNALDTGSYHDVYYQEFDARTQSWNGQPLQLTTATGSNDQYYANDVAVTEQGALVVAITTHRGPPQSTWNGGWAAGILVRPYGAAQFDPVRQVNTDTYGQRIDLQAVGEVVHMAFRTNTGLYGIRYRAFDVAAGQFTTASDVQVDTGTSNVSQIAADASGGIYVLYVAGGTSPGAGEIRIAYAAPNSPGTFTTQPVATDADLVRGNVSDYHYSLASTGGDEVWAVYSKKTGEQYQNLYMRPYAGGAAIAPEVTVLRTTDADRFRFVGGVRNPGTSIPPAAVVESRATVHVGNRVDFYALTGSDRGVRYGIGCGAGLPAIPILRTVGWPSSATLTLELADAPANQPAALLISGACLPVPFDLTALGLTGCRLEIASPDSAPWAIGPNGTARFSITPPTPVPYAGVPFQLQSVVIAPGANPAGVVLTNAQTVVFD